MKNNSDTDEQEQATAKILEAYGTMEAEMKYLIQEAKEKKLEATSHHAKLLYETDPRMKDPYDNPKDCLIVF